MFYLTHAAFPPPAPDHEPIPVIAYHAISGPPEFAGGPRFDVHGLNIPESTFGRQLNLMYERGFLPVNMRDVVRKRIHLPRGKRPVVLTFDDGRSSQFRYMADGKIDPHCAVGILLSFHQKHPEWAMRGSFYLIGGSDENGVPFDQEGLERRKVRRLLDWGFEIGNHTLTHPSLRALSAGRIEGEIDGCVSYLKRMSPGIKVDTLALPYGQLPLDPPRRKLLQRPRLRKYHYRNIGVLLVGGGLCPSPWSRNFDPYRIPRITPKPGYVERILSR